MNPDFNQDQLAPISAASCVQAQTLQQVLPLCLAQYRAFDQVSQRDIVVPFLFANCMIFLSGDESELQVDVAVSAPVALDVEIKSSHLNTRFVMNQMLAAAIELYGSDGQQDYAMGFLFRDGCGLVKSERRAGSSISLIERQAIRFEYPIQFAVTKGQK